jgi:hypothetical protein
MAIDEGSGVGRFTFEMSLKSDFTIGVDNSTVFIGCARELMMNRRMKIDLKEEGLLQREHTLTLPDSWDSRKIEFIVGDAQALPYPSSAFSSLASLNLVDKVPAPLRHMRDPTSGQGTECPVPLLRSFFVVRRCSGSGKLAGRDGQRALFRKGH